MTVPPRNAPSTEVTAQERAFVLLSRVARHNRRAPEYGRVRNQNRPWVVGAAKATARESGDQAGEEAPSGPICSRRGSLSIATTTFVRSAAPEAKMAVKAILDPSGDQTGERTL